MRVRVCASFAICLLILVPYASAQKTSGTITGTLTDPSGAVVPGATVSVVNERTAAARETMTNEEGSFSLPELEAGTYRLTVNKAGFKKLALKNVEAVLNAAGSDLSRVLQMTIYISDIELWGKVNETYARVMGEHRPARAIVPVKDLHFGTQIEIQAIAAKI